MLARRHSHLRVSLTLKTQPVSAHQIEAFQVGTRFRVHVHVSLPLDDRRIHI